MSICGSVYQLLQLGTGYRTWEAHQEIPQIHQRRSQFCCCHKEERTSSSVSNISQCTLASLHIQVWLKHFHIGILQGDVIKLKWLCLYVAEVSVLRVIDLSLALCSPICNPVTDDLSLYPLVKYFFCLKIWLCMWERRDCLSMARSLGKIQFFHRWMDLGTQGF